MYRLRVVPIFISSRCVSVMGDMLLLADHFIAELNQRSTRRIERLSDAAAQTAAYDWPEHSRAA